MEKKQKKYYEIGSISKACLLIDMLSTRKSWELTDICKAVGMPKTTVHRMLLTLEDNGYVIQEKERGEYCLSFKLFSIGSRMIRHSNLVDIARPYCQELLHAVDETVNLCVASGLEMLVVEKQVTTQMLRQDSIVGNSFPVFQSASGKVFLAFAEEEEANKVYALANGNYAYGNVSKSLSTIKAELETVRKTGLAYDYEEVFKGVRCIAAPIYNYQNQLVAALSISIPTVRLNKNIAQKIEKSIKETSTKISLRLGASTRCLPFP